MSKDYRNELNEMYRLMNYGMCESKKTTANQGIVEYSQLGADGKTYGILKEGTKYYVKVAPKKNTAILAEDFDYIGGRERRKAYESYTKASNALNLQLISVNEAAGSKTPVKPQYSLNESAEWKNSQTNEARTELNRFYQLVSRVDSLLNENVHYVNENKKDAQIVPGRNEKTTVPVEGGKKVDAESVYNKNGVKGSKPGKGEYKAAAGNPDGITKEGGDPFQEKSKTSKEQGKSVANESRRTIKLSEEQERQITAWRRSFVHNDEEGLVDRSHGTQIGDTAPWNDKVNEGFDTTEWDDGLPKNAGVGDAKEYDEPFDEKNNVSENYIFEVELDESLDLSDGAQDAFDDYIYSQPQEEINTPTLADLKDGISDKELEGEAPEDVDGLLGDIPETDEDPIHGYDDTDAQTFGNESDGYGMGNAWDDTTAYEQGNLDEGHIFEVTLNDFGKHPAYRKKPMTLPQNADGSEWGEDWNDESAKGEQPYGRQIGHGGDPFTDTVSAITNAVVTALASKKKI